MKKQKKSNSWRGGRGRAPMIYQIQPGDMRLVQWYDGSYEWISKDQLYKTFNRFTCWDVRGLNCFPTRRSAEKAIMKMAHTVTLSRMQRKSHKHKYGRIKIWVYPASKKPLPPLKSSARFVPTGTLITFTSEVSIYNLDDFEDPNRTSRRVDKGSLGFVCHSSKDGLLTKVFSDNFSGWIETKYLSEVNT